MDVASSKERKTYDFFLEGTSWPEITSMLPDVEVRLIRINVVNHHLMDEIFGELLTDFQFIPYKTDLLTMSELTHRMTRFPCQEPIDLLISCEAFNIFTLFPGAYLIKCKNKALAEWIAACLENFYIKGIREAVAGDRPYASKGWQKEFKERPRLDLFVMNRSNLWLERVKYYHEKSFRVAWDIPY